MLTKTELHAIRYEIERGVAVALDAKSVVETIDELVNALMSANTAMRFYASDEMVMAGLSKSHALIEKYMPLKPNDSTK